MINIASLEQRLERNDLAETGWKGSLQALEKALDATKLMLASVTNSIGLLRAAWRTQDNVVFCRRY